MGLNYPEKKKNGGVTECDCEAVYYWMFIMQKYYFMEVVFNFYKIMEIRVYCCIFRRIRGCIQIF